MHVALICVHGQGPYDNGLYDPGNIVRVYEAAVRNGSVWLHTMGQRNALDPWDGWINTESDHWKGSNYMKEFVLVELEGISAVNDVWNRVGPGMGEIDWKAVVAQGDVFVNAVLDRNTYIPVQRSKGLRPQIIREGPAAERIRLGVA